MTKKINEKTSGISLAGFQPRHAAVAQTAAADELAQREPKSFTGAGIFMAAITGKDELAKELAQVQGQLAEANKEVERFAGAEIVRALDPHCIRASHWANRSEASLKSKDFENLKLEIANAGGNIQPIKIRPLRDLAGEFEIVFGHRRHRACLELGIPVHALIEDISDAELFVQMDRENRQRADLRPYEQGLSYSMALDDGLFPSLRKMAEALGVDVGNASKAINLAKLPADVLAAFASPMDLQQAWATPLGAALQKNPELVLSRARALAERTTKSPSLKVFNELVGVGVVSNNTPTEAHTVIKGSAGKSGKIGFNPKTKRFEISLAGLDASQMQTIEKVVKTLLS